MKFKLIACKSMFRELSYLASMTENIIDATFIRQGYHDTPELLHKVLQQEISNMETGNDPHTNAIFGSETNVRTGTLEDFDGILIGYGLCSNGIIGLHSNKYPLIIPRGHDCITMLLGSKEKYKEYFNLMPGCFWYTPSWIESCSMPCKETHERELNVYREMGYDEDEIDFFKEALHSWTKNYHYAAYINNPLFKRPDLEKFTKDSAEYFNWNYRCINGDMSMLERFINGKWDNKEFLVVPARYTVYATNDERIIDCKKIKA